MLDHITAIDYDPGSNLKWHGVGSNWIFLMPRLDLARIVCIGKPKNQMLSTLQYVSNELICTLPVPGADIIVQSLEQISSASADCVFVCDVRNVSIEEINRILKPDGLMYYEYHGKDRTGFATKDYTADHYWLTPAVGDVQTAVNTNHVHAKAFVRQRHIYSSSIRQQTFDRFEKRIIERTVPLREAAGEGTGQTFRVVRCTAKYLKRITKTMLRKTRNVLIQLTQAIEQALTHGPVTCRWFRRYGVVLQRGDLRNGEPPHYLASGAEGCGFDINRWEWAFVAKGDFPSQKLLFYLFREDQQRPSVIVKMVRMSQYNERLEREHKGLSYLNSINFSHSNTIPEITFQGYHRDLFFIGESSLEGQPFVTKSSFDSQCRYARFVVQWIVDLGILTRSVVDGADVATLLAPLYQRFVEFYEPSETQQRFLQEHIDRLSHADCIPLVFRHGDPGLQNLLVTPQDTVAFLDWENAELKGLPLWDLFYFLSAYCIKAGEITGKFSTLDAYEHFFLNRSSIQPLIIEAVNRYCKAVGIEHDLAVSLYYIFWMYRALKQTPRVNPSRMNSAMNWRLLQLNIDRSDSDTLQVQGLRKRLSPSGMAFHKSL